LQHAAADDDSRSLLHRNNPEANHAELHASYSTDLDLLSPLITALAGNFEEDDPPPPPPSRGRVVSVQQEQQLPFELEEPKWSHTESLADCSLCISSDPRFSETLGLEAGSRYFMLPVAVRSGQA
jgi:hypothetical protein